MKVYVAGGFEEREMVSGWMRRLREAGIVVTHDWTQAETTVPGVTSDAQLTAEQAGAFAMDDMEGVERADLLWHIVASYRGARGSYFETGAAFAMGKLIIVSGPDWRKTIFHHLASRQFETHVGAFAAILERATWER